MDFELSQKIAQSAITDERADGLELSPGGGSEIVTVTLTPEELAERRDRRNEAERKAFETGDGADKAGVRAAFENDTAAGETSFTMGGGNDVFGFGDWNGSTIAGDTLTVDMGAGENDTVILNHSIEDYVFSAGPTSEVVIFNETSGILISFESAEQFVFKNSGTKDGIGFDFLDTRFSASEMLAIASGDASADIAVAEFIADSAMSTLGIDAGEDGVYVDISIG